MLLALSSLFPCSQLECLLCGIRRVARRHTHLGDSDTGLKEALGMPAVTASVASTPSPSTSLLKIVFCQPVGSSAILLARNLKLPAKTYQWPQGSCTKLALGFSSFVFLPYHQSTSFLL